MRLRWTRKHRPCAALGFSRLSPPPFQRVWAVSGPTAEVPLSSGAQGCFASASESGLKVIRLVTARVTHRRDSFVPKWERGARDGRFGLTRGHIEPTSGSQNLVLHFYLFSAFYCCFSFCFSFSGSLCVFSMWSSPKSSSKGTSKSSEGSTANQTAPENFSSLIKKFL